VAKATSAAAAATARRSKEEEGRGGNRASHAVTSGRIAPRSPRPTAPPSHLTRPHTPLHPSPHRLPATLHAQNGAPHPHLAARASCVGDPEVAVGQGQCADRQTDRQTDRQRQSNKEQGTPEATERQADDGGGRQPCVQTAHREGLALLAGCTLCCPGCSIACPLRRVHPPQSDACSRPTGRRGDTQGGLCGVDRGTTRRGYRDGDHSLVGRLAPWQTAGRSCIHVALGRHLPLLGTLHLHTIAALPHKEKRCPAPPRALSHAPGRAMSHLMW
jgi:hypothetical protein